MTQALYAHINNKIKKKKKLSAIVDHFPNFKIYHIMKYIQWYLCQSINIHSNSMTLQVLELLLTDFLLEDI
jgi:hypothetical protein